jgi:hypothetical protein
LATQRVLVPSLGVRVLPPEQILMRSRFRRAAGIGTCLESQKPGAVTSESAASSARLAEALGPERVLRPVRLVA